MSYVDREALAADGWHLQRYVSGDGYARVETLDILAIPAADVVEVRHGRWLSKDMYGDAGLGDMWIDRLAEQSDYYAYCSICGKDAEYNAEGSLILTDYCPHCGAKMDGGANK